MFFLSTTENCINFSNIFVLSKMKFFTGALLASSASAAVGRATLEWNVSSDSGAGSNGKLKVFSYNMSHNLYIICRVRQGFSGSHFLTFERRLNSVWGSKTQSPKMIDLAPKVKKLPILETIWSTDSIFVKLMTNRWLPSFKRVWSSGPRYYWWDQGHVPKDILKRWKITYP